jgi:hypothetical protein
MQRTKSTTIFAKRYLDRGPGDLSFSSLKSPTDVTGVLSPPNLIKSTKKPQPVASYAMHSAEKGTSDPKGISFSSALSSSVLSIYCTCIPVLGKTKILGKIKIAFF